MYVYIYVVRWEEVEECVADAASHQVTILKVRKVYITFLKDKGLYLSEWG